MNIYCSCVPLGRVLLANTDMILTVRTIINIMRHIWLTDEIEIINNYIKKTVSQDQLFSTLKHIRSWEIREKITNIRNKPQNFWKKEEVEKLKILMIDNHTLAYMASQLNRSIGSVSAKTKEINDINNFQWNENKINFVKNKINAGWAYIEISKELNCAKWVVSAKCEELKIKSKRGQQMREQIELRKHNKRRCPCCNIIKDLNDFGYKLATCSECAPAHMIEIRNKQSLITKIRIKIGAAKHSIKNDKYKSKNMELSINEYDVLDLWEKQKQKCFYTGIEMTYAHGDPNCFSIDRKNSKIGYTKDNICLCCTWVNTFKTSMPFEKFIWVARKISEHTKDIVINYNPENQSNSPSLSSSLTL